MNIMGKNALVPSYVHLSNTLVTIPGLKGRMGTWVHSVIQWLLRRVVAFVCWNYCFEWKLTKWSGENYQCTWLRRRPPHGANKHWPQPILSKTNNVARTMVREAIGYQIGFFFTHCVNGPCPPPPLGFTRSCCGFFWQIVEECVNVCRDIIWQNSA